MLGLSFPGPVPEEAVEWVFGSEQAAVARAVLRGEGFADPFARGTGPTAWCGVVYPAVLAGVMGVFGLTGQAVAFATAFINAVFSAATAVGLLRLGQALGRARHGRVAAWVWVVHPGAVYFPLSYVWDTAILAWCIVWLLVLVARGGRQPSRRRALVIGLTTGAIALMNVSVLAIVPAIVLYWSLARPRAGWIRTALIFGLGTLLALAPLLIRNRLLLGTFKPKANLGVELMVGNNDEADGGFRPHLHPRHNAEELAAYRELGEVGYDQRCRAVFTEWVREHPGDFARLTAERVKLLWFGFSPFEDVPLRSGERKPRDWQGWIKWAVYFIDGVLALGGLLTYADKRGGRILVGGSLVLFPLLYYAVHVMERYRFPIEPVMVYLAVGFLGFLAARFIPGSSGLDE